MSRVKREDWHLYLNEGSLREVQTLKERGVDVEHILEELTERVGERMLGEGYELGNRCLDEELKDVNRESFDAGYRDGYLDGLSRGYQDGQDDTQAVGLDAAYERGVEAGRSLGWDEGYRSGEEAEWERDDLKRSHKEG